MHPQINQGAEPSAPSRTALTNSKAAELPLRAVGASKKKDAPDRGRPSFCCLKRVKRCLNKGKNEQKVSGMSSAFNH